MSRLVNFGYQGGNGGGFGGVGGGGWQKKKIYDKNIISDKVE